MRRIAEVARTRASKSAIVCVFTAQRGTAVRGFASSHNEPGLPTYKHGIHRSNAESLVKEVPVILVDAHVAVCDGGSGALGHPVEYIQLDTVSNKPQICKYCGLRFKMGELHYH